MAAFLIWALLGIFFVGLGIYDYNSKKEVPFGFWANAEKFLVKDVKAYNRALGILWIVFGIVFAISGIPLLAGQNSPVCVISIPLAMFEAIAVMVVYVVVIERKYRK